MRHLGCPFAYTTTSKSVLLGIMNNTVYADEGRNMLDNVCMHGVYLLRHAGREVDGCAEVHALPVAVEQEAELLRAAQCEHRDEHLPAAAHALVHLSKLFTCSAYRRLIPVVISIWYKMNAMSGKQQSSAATFWRKSRSRQRFESRIVVA